MNAREKEKFDNWWANQQYRFFFAYRNIGKIDLTLARKLAEDAYKLGRKIK